MDYFALGGSAEKPVRENTMTDDHLNLHHIPASYALTQEADLSHISMKKRRKIEPASGGGTLSMREFFEAGGRAYEVYLSCKDRRTSMEQPSNAILSPRINSCSPPKDIRKLSSDSVQNMNTDGISRSAGAGTQPLNPALLTVVHITTTSGQGQVGHLSPPYLQAHAGTKACDTFPEIPQDTSTDSDQSFPVVSGNLVNETVDKTVNSDDGHLLLQPTGNKDPTAKSRTVGDIRNGNADKLRNMTTPSSTVPCVGNNSPSSDVISVVRACSSPSPVCSVSPISSVTHLGPFSSGGSTMEPVENKHLPITMMRNCSMKLEGQHEIPDSSHFAIDLSHKRLKTISAGSVGNNYVTETLAPSNAENLNDDVRPKITYQSATIFSDVTQWSVDQVARFVANVQGCRDYAEVFRQEEIDGACLIRLSERHLLDVIKMKLGPAIRLIQAIKNLRIEPLYES